MGGMKNGNGNESATTSVDLPGLQIGEARTFSPEEG